MPVLTFEDFKSDYQHLVVRGSKLYEVINFIEENYSHISKQCLEYINYPRCKGY